MFYNKATLWKGSASSGAASYRYWRVQIDAAVGDTSYGGAAEIELRGSVGGSDLSNPSSPTSSNVGVTPSFTTALAIDNNLSSFWITDVNPPFPYYITIDLASPTSVAELAFAPQTPTRAPINLSVYGSNDNSTFTLVNSYTGMAGGWTASVLRTFTL